MKLSLHDRVEKFLNKVSYLSFTHSQPPYGFSFIFQKEQREDFSNKNNNEDVRDYFRGRNMKLVIFTPNTGSTQVSLVDTETADTIRLYDPKFVTQNLLAFVESKVPENAIFTVTFMCFMPDPDNPSKMMAVISDYWTDKKLLKIHGYSLLDNRS